FKLPILVELCRRAAEDGETLDRPISIPGNHIRTEGGTGLSCMLDDVTMSLRDLAFMMMSISDNRATDVLIDHLGLEAINKTTERFGLTQTRLASDCRGLFDQITEDLGDELSEQLLVDPSPSTMAALRSLRVLNPDSTSRST